MKVAVYFNLHRKTFSVKALEGENKGRVIHHADHVHLENAKFKVSQAGRERVLREKRKNVHAFVIGELKSLVQTPIVGERVTYNPYLYDTFVFSFNKQPVHSAKEAFLSCENKKASIYA